MLNPKLSILNINTSQEQNQEPPLLNEIKNERKDKIKLHLYGQWPGVEQRILAQLGTKIGISAGEDFIGEEY